MLSLGDDCCGYVFVFKVCARTVHVCSVYTHVLTETTLKSEGFCSLNLTFLLPLTGLNCVGSQINPLCIKFLFFSHWQLFLRC